MISAAPMRYAASHGSMEGMYSLKLSTRDRAAPYEEQPSPGSVGVAIKRLSRHQPNLRYIQMEAWYSYTPSQDREGLGEEDIRAFGFFFDLQDKESRWQPGVRYVNSVNGKLKKSWQIFQASEGVTREQWSFVDCPPKVCDAGKAIINYVDDQGYLRTDLETIRTESKTPLTIEDLQAALPGRQPHPGQVAGAVGRVVHGADHHPGAGRGEGRQHHGVVGGDLRHGADVPLEGAALQRVDADARLLPFGERHVLLDSQRAQLVAEALDSVLALVHDAQLRRRMGRSGQALARQKFDAGRNGRALLDLVVEAGETRAEPTTVIDWSEGYPEVVRVGAGDPTRFEAA